MRREWLVGLGLLGWCGCSNGDAEPSSTRTPRSTNAPGAVATSGGANANAGGFTAIAGSSAANAGAPGMAPSGAGSAGAPSSTAGNPNIAGGAPSAGAAGATGVASAAGAGADCTGEASYSVTVNITWADEAVAGKHFTAVVGAVHSAALDVWHPGGLATPGVKQMAESGGTQALSAEVQAAIAQGKALSIVKFGGGNPPASSMGQILVNAQFPFVSLGSMIAPTPDNFVGLSSLNLCEEGQFIGSKTIDAVVYDAGTKDGDGFTYGSGPTTPPASIARAEQFSAAQGTIALQRL